MGSIQQNETVKMLVLETDEPHPDTVREKGSFGEILDRFFTQAGQEHDPPLGVETDMHFVVDDAANGHEGHVPSVREIPTDTTAILITGSLYDAHGSDPWILSLRDLIHDLWSTRPQIKFAGICFGHQLLASVLSATVEPTPGDTWELAHTALGLSDVGRKLFKTADDSIDVHQMHQDRVSTVPSAATTHLLAPEQKVHVWASTAHTPIQGLYVRDRLFTSQGHLGFDEQMVRRQVELRLQSGAIRREKHDEQVQYAEETAHLEHDGAVVAAAILRFFWGDDHDVE